MTVLWGFGRLFALHYFDYTFFSATIKGIGVPGMVVYGKRSSCLVLRSSFEESLRSINYEKKHELVADDVSLHEFHSFGSRSGYNTIPFQHGVTGVYVLSMDANKRYSNFFLNLAVGYELFKFA